MASRIQQFFRLTNGRQQCAVCFCVDQAFVFPDRNDAAFGIIELVVHPPIVSTAVGQAIQWRTRVPKRLRDASF